ncbi:MAG: hypothetical protein COW03_11000 [Cytophagales bacterium CG12_big_fil_rev_8_21_14_0_65_40_12]|nr:MAG: hypothetical protein COW03_11000 [Cytophagales bacterium CG12_big_fil_rev_8_21_14_0_65_40_12]PIW05642.1 MAG: hypothetical protein COW40_04145 [Cytophagales bacterium CG17_big_fil_post_rev_8_21_14_2_50_40_13]
MKFRIETWTINKLIDAYSNEKLNLNPPYQRKYIWSLKDQQTLIDSLLRGFAIPNIFLFEKKKDVFEMVDGQQRTRTIIGFLKKAFKNLDNKYFDEQIHSGLMSYEIPVTIIEELEKDESIERFYSLVNRAGVHLNRPELNKSEYFDTHFQRLITELADLDNFQSLGIFTELSTKRMNDVDFVAELVTLMKEGVSDKKIKVDKLFETDISVDDYEQLKSSFSQVIAIFKELDQITPIKKTRYKQRNDFYTLFDIFYQYRELPLAFFKEIYETLVVFGDAIIPSNEKCEPFQDYAFHCVSQSNSKNARDIRRGIIRDLFFNNSSKPNKNQKKVLKYYDLQNDSLKEMNGFLFPDFRKVPINEQGQ